MEERLLFGLWVWEENLGNSGRCFWKDFQTKDLVSWL